MFKYRMETEDTEKGKRLWKFFDCDLTDEEYDGLKTVINFLGGCWRQKEKCFVFDYNPVDMLEDMLEQYRLKNFDALDVESLKGVKQSTSMQTLPIAYRLWQEKLSYFPTPFELAAIMVMKADLTCDDVVLEPSAGQGAIAQFIMPNVKKRYLVEPDAHNCKRLRNKGFSPIQATFESFCESVEHEPITKIVMNPPFADFTDLKHVKMAYDLLADGGTLVAVISENNLYYDSTETTMFRQFLKDREQEGKLDMWELDFGSFQHSGTMVYTRLLKITK